MDWSVLRKLSGRALFFALVGGLAFQLFWGEPGWGAAFALAIYLARQLYFLAALRAWAEHPRRVELPEPAGTWGEVYEKLLDLQRRNRKRKQRLAAMLAQFQASAQALPDGAAVTEERGEIVWFNTAAQAMLGLRGQQDTGLRIANLVRHPAFTRYLEAGDFSSDVEVPSPVNAGAIVSLKVIPYGNSQKLLIVRDVSERKRLEEMRRDFVANASHELRTPLTVLRGYLEVMDPETRGAGPLATWAEPVAEMRKQAARMESLINDLLKLARLESELTARPEVLDVAQLVRAALDGARAVSKGQHRFEQDIQAGFRLVGREGELQSVFANLLQNAVQYTPPGGSIRVRWRISGSGEACFSVADSGIGINAREIPRLTERFYRVDVARSRASGGTGLGLSIVKHALDRHEARLEIESEPGVGSTFTCRFPPHRVVRAAEPETPSQIVQ